MLISHARKKIREPHSLNELFKNEQGAIDLASIMVGIIVIGLIGGVIAATVFAVIPWSQDNAAKQQLDSVVAAESAYFGLSADTPPALPVGAKANSFGNSAELAAAKLMGAGPNYCVVTPADGKSYIAYSKSGSGALFQVTDKNSKAGPLLESIPDPLPADCQFLAGAEVETPTPTPPASYVDPTPTRTVLTYKCTTTTSGMIPLAESLNGTETWSNATLAPQTYNNTVKPISRTLLGGVEYTVTFEGTYKWFTSNSTETNNLSKCLTAVKHLGSNTGLETMAYAFNQANKLTDIPAHIPSTVTSLNWAFYGTTALNDPDISSWDVSKVTSLYATFYQATIFNQPLNSWNVSNITDMRYAFYGATQFNRPLDSWNVSKVTNMSTMFYNATAFNQNLSGWTTTGLPATGGGIQFASGSFPISFLPPKTTK